MPRSLVAPPPVLATRHGLLVSAYDPEDTEALWQTGFHYSPSPCEAPGTFPICPTPKTPADVANVSDARDLIDGEPFNIQHGYRCRPYDKGIKTEAERLLISGQERTAEYLFGSNPDGVATPGTGIEVGYLQNTATCTVIPQTNAAADQPFSAVYGVGLLAQALANTGGSAQGMIHITPLVETALWGANQLEVDGLRLRLKTGGHIVVVGSGYDANGPGGLPDAANNHWIYGTGPVVKRLGQISVNTNDNAETSHPDGALDTNRTTITVTASRTFAAYFDPCTHYGVLVDPGKGVR